MELIIVFILGVSIGSFINAAVFRIHEGKSVLKGRSKCMKCEEPIAWWDLVPILSYLQLKARCRRCKSVIAWQYPAVEFVTGLLFVVAYYATLSIEPNLGLQGMMGLLLRNWIFIAYLVIIFVYDLKHMLILDKLTIPAMIVALLVNMWLGIIPLTSLLLGALVLGGFFYGQYVLSKGTRVGGGDIRLGALIGLMIGLQQGLLAVFLAYLFGAIISVMLLASKKVDRKTPIPFGTFLTLGTLVVLFYGPKILGWYLGFFG